MYGCAVAGGVQRRSDPSLRHSPVGPAARRPPAPAPAPSAQAILDLQRTAGNRSVGTLLSQTTVSRVAGEALAPPAPPATPPVLRRGSQGPAVKTLQERLNDLKVVLPALNPDGQFGGMTFDAVRSFQSTKGLAPDGVVGPKTQEVLAGDQTVVDGKDSGGGVVIGAGNTFSQKKFTRKGTRFDSEYDVVGPEPAKGTLTITLRVKITFQNFTAADMTREPFRSHTFTDAQKADFKWTEAEKKSFGDDFAKSVKDGWSDKHPVVLNDPAMAKHRADVKVNVELVKSGAAHNHMTALKIPKGGQGEKPVPRFRSFVSGNTSKLDQRDPTEIEVDQVRDRKYIRQIRGFGHDSATIDKKVGDQISTAASELKGRNIKLGEVPDPDGTARDWQLFSVGRTTQSGTKEHNKSLADDRAKAVLDQLNAEVGWGKQGTAMSAGEENTTEEGKYRRVDILVADMAGRHEVKQNTAAHEAGHMFGLGDEYVEEDAKDAGSKKFTGDESSHFGDVKAQLGSDAAEEMIVQNSGSIMSKGGEVKRGHYVYFLIDLEKMTKKEWTVQ